MASSACVIVTSAGRRVHLLETLRADAASLGVALRLIAVDVDPRLSAACAMADECFAVPPCMDPEYVPSLRDICLARGVHVLIPTIDTELPVLADARASFAGHGTSVIVSSQDAVRVARDKLRTASVLAEHGLPTPLTDLLQSALGDVSRWPGPVVVKPRDGSNSRDVVRLPSLAAARDLCLSDPSLIVQSLCVGPEFTVNCFADAHSRVVAAVPHRRIEVRGGEVSKALTERRPELTQLASRIALAIPGLRGPFCFQVMLTAAGPLVIEINARFGGGYPIAHKAGAHFGKWLLEEWLGRDSSASDDWESELLMLRHDAATFIHCFRA